MIIILTNFVTNARKDTACPLVAMTALTTTNALTQYLLLLILFIAAGIYSAGILHKGPKYEGTINGLILYANVVWPYDCFSLPTSIS